LLAESFLERAASGGSPRATLGPAALSELRRRPWHGNVRELRNAMERAAMLARGGVIEPEHLPAVTERPLAVAELTDSQTPTSELLAHYTRRWAEERLAERQTPTDLFDAFLRIVEPPLLETVLDRNRRQCASAARVLGIHRITLRKKLDEYGVTGE
jgi:two-component system nitrogen regulation response regulator GlnG